MFSKIVVALDTSEICAPVFEQALALAQAMNAKLNLLSILTPASEGTLPLVSYPGVTGYPLVVNEAAGAIQTQKYKEYKAKGLSILSDFVERAALAGVQAEFAQATGDPGREICNYAKTEKADLIVVGSHRRRGLNELLTGSVSSYVMHRASCSVLVVHDKKVDEAADKTDA